MIATAAGTLLWLNARRVRFGGRALLSTVARSMLVAAVSFTATWLVSLLAGEELGHATHVEAARSLVVLGGVYVLVAFLLAPSLGLDDLAMLPAKAVDRISRALGMPGTMPR
jgi:hypothetical protein